MDHGCRTCLILFIKGPKILKTNGVIWYEERNDDEEQIDINFKLYTFTSSYTNLNKQMKEKLGIIWFGGLDAETAAKILNNDMTVSVCFGNINFEKELAMINLRKQIEKIHNQRIFRNLIYR